MTQWYKSNRLKTKCCVYLQKRENTEGHGVIAALLELVVNLPPDPSIPSSAMARNHDSQSFESLL
jgi:hypothetical protein